MQKLRGCDMSVTDAAMENAQKNYEEICEQLQDKINECNELRSSINRQETEILELNCAVQSRDQTIEKQRDEIYEATKDLHERDLLIDELRKAHKRQNVSKGANLIYDKLLVAECRLEFLEKYTDEQGRTIMELEWQIHQLKEEG